MSSNCRMIAPGEQAKVFSRSFSVMLLSSQFSIRPPASVRLGSPNEYAEKIEEASVDIRLADREE